METDGRHRNIINLKGRGTAPLTDLIRVHALACGSKAQNSLDRLDAIAATKLLPKEALEHLRYAFEFHSLVRVRHQAREVEAGNAPALWQLARRVPTPQLALVDLNMPGMERGLRLASLAREQPRLPLIVVSALTSPDVVRRALDVPSVCAFVPKSAGVARMREAIEAALQGRRLDPWLPDAAAAEALPDTGLTPRMQEIRALLRQGLSNKHIAQQLDLSEGTVKNYMSDIFRLLSVSNRTQAAQYNPDTA